MSRVSDNHTSVAKDLLQRLNDTAETAGSAFLLCKLQDTQVGLSAILVNAVEVCMEMDRLDMKVYDCQCGLLKLERCGTYSCMHRLFLAQYLHRLASHKRYLGCRTCANSSRCERALFERGPC